MKLTIATKYILKEFIPTFVICFCFFFMMYIINHILLIIKPLIEKNVPFNYVFLMIVTIMPLYTMFCLPFALLLSSLMTLGRLSSDNEIVAFRSLGFNIMKIFGPIFIVGMILMVIAFFINDSLRPIGLKAQFETKKKISSIKPTLFFKSKTVKKYGSKVIFTDIVKDKSINGLIIIDRDSDGQKRIITSKEALFQTPKGMKEAVEIKMNNAMVQFENKERPEEFNFGYSDSISYYIRFRDFESGNPFSGSAETKTTGEIVKDLDNSKKLYREELNNKNMEFIKNTEIIKNTSVEIIKNINENYNKNTVENHLKTIDDNLKSTVVLKTNNVDKGQINKNLVFFFDKFSLPIACFVFVIFGTPLGVYSKRAGYAFGFVLGLFLCSFYWFFYYGMLVAGKKQALPPFIAIFLPNMIFLVVGLLLLVKRLKE